MTNKLKRKIHYASQSAKRGILYVFIKIYYFIKGG